MKISCTKVLSTSQDPQAETCCQIGHVWIHGVWNFLMLHLVIGHFLQARTIHPSPPRAPETHLALWIIGDKTSLDATLSSLFWPFDDSEYVHSDTIACSKFFLGSMGDAMDPPLPSRPRSSRVHRPRIMEWIRASSSERVAPACLSGQQE